MFELAIGVHVTLMCRPSPAARTRIFSTSQTPAHPYLLKERGSFQRTMFFPREDFTEDCKRHRDPTDPDSSCTVQSLIR